MPALILSLLGLGGVGAAAAAFIPGAAPLLLGFLKPVGARLAKIPWYVYAAVGVIALIAFLAISRGHWMDRAHDEQAQLDEICRVVRIADRNPKLDCSKTGAQIVLLGQALAVTTNALNDQTARVRALAAKSAQEQQIATEAEKLASQRADDARTVAQRLGASAAQRPSSAAVGACQPSQALQEQWK